MSAPEKGEALPQTTSAVSSQPDRELEPGTSIFFTASFFAVVINIVLIVILEIPLQQTGGTPVAVEYYLIIYALAALIGVRHLLRITVVDLYFQKRLLPRDNKAIYWAILIGTMLGSVSLTVTVAGLSWYLVILFPYLGIFLYLGIKLSDEVQKFSKTDVKDVFWTVLADAICIVAILEVYEVITQKQLELGVSFAIIALVGTLVLFQETQRVYFEPIVERLKTTRKMLLG